MTRPYDRLPPVFQNIMIPAGTQNTPAVPRVQYFATIGSLSKTDAAHGGGSPLDQAILTSTPRTSTKRPQESTAAQTSTDREKRPRSQRPASCAFTMPCGLSSDRTSSQKRRKRRPRNPNTQFEIIVPQAAPVHRNVNLSDDRTDGAKPKRRKNRKGRTRTRGGPGVGSHVRNVSVMGSPSCYGCFDETQDIPF